MRTTPGKPYDLGNVDRRHRCDGRERRAVRCQGLSSAASMSESPRNKDAPRKAGQGSRETCTLTRVHPPTMPPSQCLRQADLPDHSARIGIVAPAPRPRHPHQLVKKRLLLVRCGLLVSTSPHAAGS